MNHFLKLLSFTFLALVIQAKAMDAVTPLTTDEYCKSIGLVVKPLHIKVKDELAHECLQEFKDFRESKNTLREKSSDFQVVRSFALDVLKIQPMDFTQIECWISDSVMTPTNPMDRVLTVPCDVLAQLLNLKGTQTVTQGELEEKLAMAKTNRKAADRYGTLQYFAQSVLKYMHHEIQGLNSWVLGGSGMPMPHESAPQLKCDFDFVLRLVNIRAKRDIRQEFEEFERAYSERKERVLLNEDLMQFTMKFGSAVPMMMPSAMPTLEAIWENSMEMQKQALPKNYDISIPLMQTRHSFLQQLTSNMNDDRFRVFGRFVVCRQAGLPKEVVGPKYKEISLVNFDAGRLIYQDGEVVHTTADTIWALNPQGALCVYPQEKGQSLGLAGVHHSYFFQQEDVGTPLACAGHIEVRQGKISKITPNSGHFNPSLLQFILVLSYFHEKGVLAEDFTIDASMIPGATNSFTFQDLLKMVSMIELTDK
jgi:hypothetical protein